MASHNVACLHNGRHGRFLIAALFALAITRGAFQGDATPRQALAIGGTILAIGWATGPGRKHQARASV